MLLAVNHSELKNPRKQRVEILIGDLLRAIGLHGYVAPLALASRANLREESGSNAGIASIALRDICERWSDKLLIDAMATNAAAAIH